MSFLNTGHPLYEAAFDPAQKAHLTSSDGDLIHNEVLWFSSYSTRREPVEKITCVKVSMTTISLWRDKFFLGQLYFTLCNIFFSL